MSEPVAALLEGFDAVAIGSPDRLRATFVPAAGMVCCSLRFGGIELLAQRSGVRAYAERGSTMGIPLLYPWANRLAGPSYPGPGGAPVRLDPDDPLLKLDANRLPIHGAIAGELPWELLESSEQDGRLRARLHWRRADLLAIFPFSHTLELEARIEGEATLAIQTSVQPDPDPAGAGSDREAPASAPVPISFGFHPYLSLPGADRGDWQVELPVRRRLLLDPRMIPTGESEPFERHRFVLAEGDWDDSFAELLDPPTFCVADGRGSAGPDAGRDAGTSRIALELREGYSDAQFYAPAGASFVCFEPMTAPTNALISRDGLRTVAPGASFSATFAISVYT
ncbi:MAG TPA: aldose 1-epimerase [Solirubrobacteraceae bacterium]|jgi:galactose mutarotase-like enzyme|nr:aldose 1-epimerase [Solirubrobacteraceae bacterium]